MQHRISISYRIILRRFFSGFMIGCANIIPGVSGGTVALSLGVYEEIIGALSVKKIISEWRATIPFLVEMGCGAICGVFLVARLLGFVFENYPLVGVYFFIGLICGGIPFILRKYRCYTFKWSDIYFIILGILLVFMPRFITLQNGVQSATVPEVLNGSTYLTLFISGVVAAAAMVLPGLSGSFVLLLFGTYTIILDAIITLNIGVIGIVAVGVVVGILTCARLMRLLLMHYPRTAWALIIGFVGGSILYLCSDLPQSVLEIVICIFVLIIGFVLSYRIAKRSA